MSKVHFNTIFADMNPQVIKSWLEIEHNNLIGSAIFTQNNSFTSKIVRWAEGWKCKEGGFIPSHTGSIIEYDKKLFIFDMKPMRASIQPLFDYLVNAQDTYALILRDFELDTRMFSINVAEHIGEFYPFMSAIRSVFTKRETKWVRHCSELHLRELQKQGILTTLNPEITPDELFHELSKGVPHVSI